MLHLRKALCIFLMALMLAQPVFAEAEASTESPTVPPEPDIVTAIRTVERIPIDFSPLSAPEWLLEMTTAPLYTLSEDGTWTPVLAQSLPEDATADFAGTYGIPPDAQRGYAFRILLNKDARWEDGIPITADDYISSIETLFYQEKTAKDWLFLAGAGDIRSGKLRSGSNIISLRESGFSSVREAWGAGYTEFFVDTDGFWGLGGGWKSVSDRIRLRDYAMPSGLDEYFVTPAYLYNNYLMNGAQSSHYQDRFIGIAQTPGKKLTIDDLGLIKLSDYELVLILEEPSTASTLMQRLEPLYLFRELNNAFISYGPYRVTSATHNDILLEPNPNWLHGPDPRGYDRIFCQKIGS